MGRVSDNDRRAWILVGLACGAMACTSDDGREGSDGGIDSLGPGGTSNTSGVIDDGTVGGPGTNGGTMSGGTNGPDATGEDPKFDVGQGNDSTGGETMPCEIQQPTVTYVEPIIVFVLDKSGSMSINQFDAGPAGTITRWNALHNTVSYLLMTYDATVEFGSKLFPSVSGCPVNAGLDVNPAIGNEAAILATLPPPGADLNAAGVSQTPVQRGMEEASMAMQTFDPTKPKAVMLILDGGVSTSCAGNTFAGTQAVISNLWNTNGIPTYVIGVDIDGTTINDMNAYALAGGVPTGNPAEQFYNATNTADLDMIMDTIVGDILSCDIALDTEPDFPELTEVTVNGVMYPQVDQAACDAGMQGWYWSTQYSQITLCGVACDEFIDAMSADVAFFCPVG